MDGNGIFFYGSPHQNIGTLLFIAKLYGLQEVRGQVQGTVGTVAGGHGFQGWEDPS